MTTSTPRKRTRPSPSTSNGEASSPRRTRHRSDPRASDDELDLLYGVPAEAAVDGKLPSRQGVASATTSSISAPLSRHNNALLVQRESISHRLAGRVSSPKDLVGLEEQAAQLHQTLHATVRRQESNSILIVGAKGSGKSAILNAALATLGTRQSYHHVYLSARQCPTDRAAMRELARQLIQSGAFNLHDANGELQLEEEDDDDQEAGQGDDAGEDVGGDEELDEEAEAERREALGTAVLSSLSSTTSSILSLLAAAPSSSTTANATSAKPLIITLDAFDLLTSRPRQALLYCLLDAVQAGTYKPGLAIVGMTRRVDTTDLLEKRVKSRFSHRIVQCYPPRNDQEWQELVQKVLLTPPTTEEDQEGQDSTSASQDQAFTLQWRENVETLLSDEAFVSLVRTTTEQTKDVQNLFTLLYPPISQICPSSSSTSLLTTEPFLLTHLIEQEDSTLSTLWNLPTLPFLLLIAAKHLQTRDRNVFNFQVAFDEVVRFARKSRRNREGAGTGGMGLNLDLEVEAPDRTRRIGRGAPVIEVGLVGDGGSDWEDRRRGMMAFDTLLSLDLFLPDAFLSTLSYGPTTVQTQTQTQTSHLPLLIKPAPSRTLPTISIASRSAASSRSSSVRREYLRVRSVVEPSVVLAVARERGKKGSLPSEVIQWAVRGG